MKKRCFHHSAPGQSIVLAALAMVVLVAMVGLGLDGANAFAQRRNTANAADAASMAGTTKLLSLVQKDKKTTTGTPILTEVQSYLESHKLNNALGYTWTATYVDKDLKDVSTVTSGSIPSDARGVKVYTTYTFPTTFMAVMGRTNLTVNGTATSLYGDMSYTPDDLIPQGLKESDVSTIKGLTSFSLYDVKNPSGSNTFGTGNWKAVDFDAGNNPTGNQKDCTSSTATNTQSYWWCQGSQYPSAVGDSLNVDTGNLSTSISDAISWRITNRPYAVAPVLNDGCFGTGNTSTCTIVGYLAVQLVKVDLKGKDRYIEAKYVDFFTMTGSTKVGSDLSGNGVYSVNLVR